MITTKMLNNDLITMEKQNLIKKAGYKYNSAGDPKQKYEMTQDGNDRLWAFEFENLSDEDSVTLERSRYGATS